MSDYSVGDLITELSAIRDRADQRPEYIPGDWVEQFQGLASRVHGAAGGDPRAQLAEPIFAAIGRATGSLEDALESRYRASGQLGEYIEGPLKGERGSGSGGEGGGAGANYGSRSERRASFRFPAELTFAVVGAGLFIVGPFVPVVLSPLITVATGALILAKLTHALREADSQHGLDADNDKRRKSRMASAAGSLDDTLWTVLGEVVKIIPGMEIVALGMTLYDGGALIGEHVALLLKQFRSRDEREN